MDDVIQEQPKRINPLDKYFTQIVLAVKGWELNNTPERIQKMVVDKLEKAAHEIVLKLLGFDKNYDGKWQVDHCNGRGGNSAAGDYLRQHQQAAIEGWLEDVCLPKLKPSVSKSIQESIQKHYESELENKVRAKALAKASSDAQAIVDQLVLSNTLDDYFRTLKLINQD